MALQSSPLVAVVDRRRCALVIALLAGAGCITLSASVTPSRAAGDAAKGRQYFETYCSICHNVQPGRNAIGPTLFGVVGRKSASVPGYNYSPAFRSANMTWDQTTLDKYLANPRGTIPGTKMTYAGLKDDAKRADLIAYLATLK